ncbi:MAG: hypothetical protein SFX73_14755 [Kofleriaceae bacterium]|nr:hypothetical protein [Kofleriaceae bacterium]
MESPSMDLVGHGMLLAPECPCRAVLLGDLLVIGRGYRGPLISEVVVKRGAMPATAEPTSTDGINFSLGPDGPELLAESGNLDELVEHIDVGLGPAEWSVLAPGFSFDLPHGVVLFSPDPDEPGDLPELHHAMNFEAMIKFMRFKRAAGDIVVTGRDGKPLPSVTLETPYGAVREFIDEYEHGGAQWIQHRYVLPYADDRSIIMLAQAPVALWAELQAAAEVVACSFEPTD